MPLLKSEFRVDVIALKHHGFDLIQHMMKRAGSDIGVKIQEMIPFKKDEEKSFSSQPYFKDKERLMKQGMLMYPTRPPEDHYKLELFVTSGEAWQTFKNKLYFALIDTVGEGTKQLIGSYLKTLEETPQPQTDRTNENK